MTAVIMPHDISRPTSNGSISFELFPNLSFITGTPSLVIKLSTTTANDDGSGVYVVGPYVPTILVIKDEYKCTKMHH